MPYEKRQYIIQRKKIIMLLPTLNSIHPSPHPAPNTHTHHPALARMLTVPDPRKTISDTGPTPTHPSTHTHAGAHTRYTHHTHTHIHGYETVAGMYKLIIKLGGRHVQVCL